MWTISKKIWYMAYCAFASWLPASRHFVFAKWLRGFFAKRVVQFCGKNVNIEKHASFTPQLSIGDHSGIGIDCEINGKVTIGKYVMMGPEVVIYTSGHRYDDVTIPMQQQDRTEVQPVTIEDDVWIGRRVIILPGVTIGKGSVIGAGAVVTKSIPSYSVAVGVPAKVIKQRK